MVQRMGMMGSRKPADGEGIDFSAMSTESKPILLITNLATIAFTNEDTPMWIYDVRSLAFLAVNDAAIRRYGYSREEFLSMTILDIRPSEDVVSLLRDTLGAARHDSDRERWRHRTKGGKVMDIQITSREVIFNARLAEIVTAEPIAGP